MYHQAYKMYKMYKMYKSQFFSSIIMINIFPRYLHQILYQCLFKYYNSDLFKFINFIILGYSFEIS